MKTILPTLLAVILCLVTQAQDITAEHRASVVKMLEVSKVKEQSVTAMNSAFDTQMKAALKTMTEEQKVKMQRAITRIRALMAEALSWEVLEPKLVDIYSKKFSQEEIDAIIPLLSKPEMQTFLTKQIQLIPETSAIGAEATVGLQAKIQAIVMEELSKPE